MKIIPAIDIIGGKCVRLTQGNYGQCKIYSANPLEMARLFEEAGLDRLHLVDLDGAKASKFFTGMPGMVLLPVCSVSQAKCLYSSLEYFFSKR